MKTIYLSYDMECSCDELLKWFYELLDRMEVNGTINVTHQTSYLDILRTDSRIELGIHPNFNRLLNLTDSIDYLQIIKELRSIVPEAKTVRSHSLVKSNVLSKTFAEMGFTHESNIFIEPSCNYRNKAFKDCFNLNQVPIIFEDDLYLAKKNRCAPEWYLNNIDGHLVFNFHPIHLFLNTDTMGRYELAKPYYHDFEQLKRYRNKNGKGVFDFFQVLITEAKKRNINFDFIKNIQG